MARDKPRLSRLAEGGLQQRGGELVLAVIGEQPAGVAGDLEKAVERVDEEPARLGAVDYDGGVGDGIGVGALESAEIQRVLHHVLVHELHVVARGSVFLGKALDV